MSHLKVATPVLVCVFAIPLTYSLPLLLWNPIV